ncbi:uncharacterized protein LAESUDRAFT_765307 [Laetiporus sulphureus 93-53]|uniref:CxC2-like cysteine cluster KDZ transposase-associated domain-containing protein n=1 Tax=Laetiporus sulphureus 93-53 TaxID=1314785 RepID=A0A165ATU6_9APHY|nr:uncharacterized protein LAESUDRAFT_765307 [Laetiporus sulphureus 93-53]KZS99651.1 hypothetical protein LAESUDRAFT_765307 [Laetiporus sulphureus 93-53]
MCDNHLSVHTSYVATDAPPPPPSLPKIEESTSSIPELEDDPVADLFQDKHAFMDVNIDYIHELADMDEGQKRQCCTAGIKEWIKTHFRRKTLRQAGLCIQLGHPIDEHCGRPQPAWDDDFIILDISGIHSLLHAPNVSGFHFYAVLERRTDNTSMNPPPGRYSAFMQMMHQWRHLKLIKHVGRGHDPDGISATPPGGCTVLCPACPQPGKNLPKDYEQAPPERTWLYRLFIGINANFQLKRKKVLSDELDPGLNNGCAFFVEEKAYKDHIKMFSAAIKEESSTCNDHDAIKLANIKSTQGTAASGVGMVECTRHDMKHPCSIGDLQKGERYVNMDYLFISSMDQNAPVAMVASYNIACQWSMHLWKRMMQYSPTFDPNKREITFLIPKFHLPVHQPTCHLNFSFNITKHITHTDGETPECGWAAVSLFASSTKEMGPDSRHDLLDDVFGAYNWNKHAVSERNEQTAAFEDLTSSLPASRVAKWKAAIEAWEEDRSSANPFKVKRHKITQANVWLQLAEEDATLLQEGGTLKVHDKISPSIMIMSGLELEEQHDSSWKAELRPLENSDIQGMMEGLFDESEGWRTLSWIWCTAGVGQLDSASEDEGIQKALQVKWCKARARAQCWTEECELLVEEM